jgi:carbamoyltransferase
MVLGSAGCSESFAELRGNGARALLKIFQSRKMFMSAKAEENGLSNKIILGIWDGHDAGAALVSDDEILFAINEERLTRRKLEVGFPTLSIQACLKTAGLAPRDIATVAASTTDPAKTLTRLFPKLKEEYYLIRRRKLSPRRADPFKKAFKYRFTELAPNTLSRTMSRAHLHGQLKAMGFADFGLELIDHHTAHAAAAAMCSGFSEALVLTLDGVGDGLCGTVSTWKKGALTRVAALPAGRSLGIFFEHVTNLMNMRELEDEGKVMALANFAYPIADDENPMLEIIGVRGLEIVSRYNATQMFRALKAILWRYPSEQFACMAQRVLERCAVALVKEALRQTGMTRLAAAGGVFSNIKMNMQIAALPGLESFFVFPHMGDGGLAIGAALEANRTLHGATSCRLPDLYLGAGFDSAYVGRLSERKGIPDGDTGDAGNLGHDSDADHPGRFDDNGNPDLYNDAGNDNNLGRFDGPGNSSASHAAPKPFHFNAHSLKDPAKEAARLILAGEIILWFQGRMEIGPRALGHRSILARPDDRTIKDRLNLLLKKRVWYQPFCPSMLLEDAPALLETQGRELRDNRFMTMGFKVRPERLALMEGVINVDGTCRPHFVGDEEPLYRALLVHIKEALGYGVVLNTSLNLHGDPMVCTPEEALEMLRRINIRYLIMEDWLFENTHAKMG